MTTPSHNCHHPVGVPWPVAIESIASTALDRDGHTTVVDTPPPKETTRQ